MSGAGTGGPSDTSKHTGAITSDKQQEPTLGEQEKQKPAASLEEDDEFEDFPVEGACRALRDEGRDSRLDRC